MKYPYTGLFEYCEQLGKSLQTHLTEDDDISYYLPEKYKVIFGKREHIPLKKIHKLFPVGIRRPAVWHTTYQLSRYMKNGGRKAKKALTVHDLNFLYEKTSKGKINKYLKALQRNIDKSDHIIAISEYAKTDLVNHLKINCPLSVIYNGCNVAEFPEFDTPAYRPVHPFLFSLGTVECKKNFHVLPCLLKGNDYELIIAGKRNEDYVEKIMAEAAKHGVSERVKLTGPVTGEDKYWYLKNCAAFLFPSLAEGFGIPPLEAMHVGKPVFLSTLTSLPEIGGNHAYYFHDFDPDNLCATFESGMNHYAATRPEMSIIQHAASFNWEKSASEYMKIYKSILE
jgi:glycosyltransferase involved in cell wall biosynthesis